MDNIIIYNTDDGKVNVKLYANDGTVWLTQSQIAELFDKNISTISRHISNIFDEKELTEKETEIKKLIEKQSITKEKIEPQKTTKE